MIDRWDRVDEIMERDEGGEWCMYDDHLAALDAQRLDFARLMSEREVEHAAVLADLAAKVELREGELELLRISIRDYCKQIVSLELQLSNDKITGDVFNAMIRERDTLQARVKELGGMLSTLPPSAGENK